MLITLSNDTYQFEIKTYLRAYYPKDELVFSTQVLKLQDYQFNVDDEAIQVSCFHEGKKLYESGFDQNQILAMNLSEDPLERRKAFKKLIKQAIYTIESQKSGSTKQPWGILTGIRPTKVVFNLHQKYGDNDTKIKEILRNEYRISEEKIGLMLEIAENEKFILSQNHQEEVSLYLGIPFCPTKCLYCSFTSFPIAQWGNQVDQYLDALIQELIFVCHQMIDKRPVRSIYIGGGTPTSLSPIALERLLNTISVHIDVDKIQEFTVEAGRPDTITKEKLEILKAYGVNRISINPQTMNQKTLTLIGRGHTVEDIYRSCEDARKIGFNTINMDLIVGLPGETVNDVVHTIEAIKNLHPENLTVHTMAIKRGSHLIENLNKYLLKDAQTIEEMIAITAEGAKAIGLKPYYLYRQKHMVGNFENVGYALPGHECIYNVEIMEERQTIFALGAGATSKMVAGNKVERIENVKEVSQYIERVQEMMERKLAFKNFA